MPLYVQIEDPLDPRLADYHNVKERQLAAQFLASPLAGSADAPYGKFYAEGKVVLHHLVRSDYATLSVLATPAQVQVNAADLDLLPPATPVYVISHDAMESIIGFHIHRGLLAIGARRPPLTLVDLLTQAKARRGPLLVLENLSNHDNIGALFRNGAALGASGILLSPDCADPLYRKSLRVSVGLALRIPWAVPQSWAGVFDSLRQAGWTSLGLTPQGDRLLSEFGGERRQPTLALCLGAEGPGLTAETLKQVDYQVAIPMAIGVDSLNVATAGAVALYEIGRGTAKSVNPGV